VKYYGAPVRFQLTAIEAEEAPPAGFRSPTGALPAQRLLETLAGQMVGARNASGMRDALRQLREIQPSAWDAATNGMATTPESANDGDFVKALRAVWKEEAPRDPRTGQIAASESAPLAAELPKPDNAAAHALLAEAGKVARETGVKLQDAILGIRESNPELWRRATRHL